MTLLVFGVENLLYILADELAGRSTTAVTWSVGKRLILFDPSGKFICVCGLVIL